MTQLMRRTEWTIKDKKWTSFVKVKRVDIA